jgi:hypothetical protein
MFSQQTVLPGQVGSTAAFAAFERVCSTAACAQCAAFGLVCLTAACAASVIQQPGHAVLPPDMSFLQHPMLPPDVSVLQ